jgi:DMSO/TMAO reductase YedYZ molybdopterin-dependent catalytic subunit
MIRAASDLFRKGTELFSWGSVPFLTLALLLPLSGLAAKPTGAASRKQAEKKVVRTLRLVPGTERHIKERHFPGGRQTRGKSVFVEGTDLDALLLKAEAAPPQRQKNGRDKRVVDHGKVVGTDGRTGRPVRTYVVISEPDGLVITAYPGN